MSIYDRRKGLMDFEEYQRTPNARETEARGPGGRGQAVNTNDDWDKVRRSHPANYLLPIGERWLRGLPAEVLPAELVLNFPAS